MTTSGQYTTLDTIRKFICVDPTESNDYSVGTFWKPGQSDGMAANCFGNVSIVWQISSGNFPSIVSVFPYMASVTTPYHVEYF